MPWMMPITLTEYCGNADRMLADMDFFEVEIAHQLRVFDNIAHA